jgi:hypothetical protein
MTSPGVNTPPMAKTTNDAPTRTWGLWASYALLGECSAADSAALAWSIGLSKRYSLRQPIRHYRLLGMGRLRANVFQVVRFRANVFGAFIFAGNSVN